MRTTRDADHDVGTTTTNTMNLTSTGTPTLAISSVTSTDATNSPTLRVTATVR